MTQSHGDAEFLEVIPAKAGIQWLSCATDLKSLGSCLRRSDRTNLLTTLVFFVLIFSLCLCVSASRYFIFDAEPRRRGVFRGHSCEGRNPVAELCYGFKVTGLLPSQERRANFYYYFNFFCFKSFSVPLRLCVEIFYPLTQSHGDVAFLLVISA